jgi:hypothetical protein
MVEGDVFDAVAGIQALDEGRVEINSKLKYPLFYIALGYNIWLCIACQQNISLMVQDGCCSK